MPPVSTGPRNLQQSCLQSSEFKAHPHQRNPLRYCVLVGKAGSRPPVLTQIRVATYAQRAERAHSLSTAYPSVETVQFILGYVHLCPLLLLAAALVAVDAGQKRCEDANLKVKAVPRLGAGNLKVGLKLWELQTELVICTVLGIGDCAGLVVVQLAGAQG